MSYPKPSQEEVKFIIFSCNECISIWTYLLNDLVSPLNTYFNPWKVVSFVNSDTFSFNTMVFAELTAKNKQCFNVPVRQVGFKHIICPGGGFIDILV